MVLKLEDVDDAMETSASSYSPSHRSPEQMTAHSIDRRVGNVRNDEPGLCATSERPPH